MILGNIPVPHGSPNLTLAKNPLRQSNPKLGSSYCNMPFFRLFCACKSVLILTHHWTISTAQRQLRKLTGGYRVRARERKNTPDEVSPPLIIEFRNLHVRFVLVSYGNTCPLKTPISFWAGKKVVLKLVRRLFKTAETRAIFLIMAMNFQKLPSSANALGKATWGSNKRNVKWLFPLLL